MATTALQKWPPGSPEAQALARDAAYRKGQMHALSDRAVASQGKIAVGNATYKRDSDPPPPHKGALIAVAPDNPERGDILRFSRYPMESEVSLEVNVVSTDVAGRALPTLMNLGGKGVKIPLTVEFYDVGVDRGRYSLARAASLWFALYTVGHDGTGAALPYVHTYYQRGHSPWVRVMIERVKLTESFFDRDDWPQKVIATIEMVVFEPVGLVSPFKPKAPPLIRNSTTQPTAQAECACPGAVSPAPSPVHGKPITEAANAVGETLRRINSTTWWLESVRRSENLPFMLGTGPGF